MGFRKASYDSVRGVWRNGCWVNNIGFSKSYKTGEIGFSKYTGKPYAKRKKW